MKTFKLIYLADSGLHTLLYTHGPADGTMLEADGKRRLLTIDPDNAYPRLMHICCDGRRRTVGQYPSYQLGRDWSEGLQDQFAKELREVRGEFIFNEEVATAAMQTTAEQIVAMVQADYPNDLPMQRGIAGDYLGDTVEMVHEMINKLLED